TSNTNHLYALSHDFLDLEPDTYLYNFNGRSGKFFLKETGEIVMMGSNDGINISYNLDTSLAPPGPGIRSWIITDENGNKYYFGRTKAGTGNYILRNQSSYSGNHGNSPAEISSTSWYLTEAYDMNEENSIKYTYTLSGNIFTTISGSFMPLNTAGLDCQGFNVIGDDGVVTTDATEYLVTRIDGNSGYVIFNSAQDYANGPNKMLAVQMYDPGGNYKGQYKFNYGTNFSSMRWKLTGFSQFGAAGFDSLTHKFEYNEFNNLPSVLSPGVDIWGFSNGQFNTGMIPKMIVSNGYGDIYWDFGATRTADGANSQANILKKITYPTGGYREIIYEGNTVLGLGDFFTYHPDPNYMVSRSFTETKFLSTGGSFPSMQHLFTVNSSYNLAKFFFALGNIGVMCGSNYTVKV
ncbi:hypothetical protein, partial [Chitinophaga niastensis]|uniref:hypothetical protein n=1 Tax=Chitinophaga niastensis TaxID=536980 RepID=UPI0013047EFB